MSEHSRKVGRTLLVVAVILVVVLLLLLPPTQDLLRKFLVDPFSTQYPEEVQMEIVRTLTLDANGGEISSYTVDLPVPKSIVEDGAHLQKLDRLTVSPLYDLILDNGTHETMVWEGDELYGTFTLTMTIEVTQRLHVWELDEGIVLDKDEMPQYYQDSYLGDQWKIIVNDPEIEALREDIVGNETNVFLIAKAIYDWVDENVDYYIWTGTDGPLSSLETLEELKGDCDDQSILFCALARSAGVPAWLQLGAVYSYNGGEMGGHAWVQMFMPTEEGGTNVTIDIVNDKFLVWMPNLFCEYTDNGDADDLFNAYHHVRYSIPISTPDNMMPVYDEHWDVVSYEESEEKVTLELVMAREDF
ncbi:MAG: transglutaminase family protein [Methanomassiliicoccales archaeon]